MTPDGFRKTRAYLRYVFQIAPHGDPGDRQLLERLVRLTQHHSRQVEELETQFAMAMRHPRNDVMVAQIRQERAVLLTAFTRSLATELGPGGERRVNDAIAHVKARTRMFHR